MIFNDNNDDVDDTVITIIIIIIIIIIITTTTTIVSYEHYIISFLAFALFVSNIGIISKIYHDGYTPTSRPQTTDRK